MPAELELVAAEAATCVRCALAETRTQVVFGVGDPAADLLFVGEGPGAEEDRLGEPFVGRSGKLLDQLVLEEMGLTRSQFHITNVVKCRPPDNRDPKPEEIEACNPWLERQLELMEPKVVVTLGNFAMRTLLQTRDGITKVRGRSYPFRGGHGGLSRAIIPVHTTVDGDGLVAAATGRVEAAVDLVAWMATLATEQAVRAVASV